MVARRLYGSYVIERCEQGYFAWWTFCFEIWIFNRFEIGDVCHVKVMFIFIDGY